LKYGGVELCNTKLVNTGGLEFSIKFGKIKIKKINNVDKII
jgi:hypothetical protein